MTISVRQQSADLMKEAASKFLDSLDENQKSIASFEYLDGERLFWYYPPMNRHGLPLRDMNKTQRDLAFALMASGLTQQAYNQAKQIIDLELLLGSSEKERGIVTFVRDPALYYFTVFGDPLDSENPWGWRVEGHHISIHFSVWKNEVISTTPFFFGSNPAEVIDGPKSGLRILSAREDMALILMQSLDASQKSTAIIYDKAPSDLLTYNASKVVLPREEGLPASKMNTGQRQALMSLIGEYIKQVKTDISYRTATTLSELSLDDVFLAWAGPIDLSKAHYYRIHAGNFLVEFDNAQNGANHIHSVWRDIENDFAQDVMRDHHLAYHVL